ncbi:MAG: AAA family ATPase [Candidatus Thiothrix putei]|uniref:AAA family ATPase n=1 Tax=Candidatus Thiothrix putei TaxID=3080811 RepID=A0AA95KRW7_9GAMM|nr:MAG: AAA family ATPase [Candidatus Thiothrix putei]
MIKELKLKHWKSFDEATLYIDPLTIIIGTNASGKSNTLDALTFLHRVSLGMGIFQAIGGDVNLPALRGGMEWVCLKPNKQFSLEVITDGANSKQDYRYHLTVEVNGTKAEVLREELVLITYRSRSEPTEKTLFYTKHEESSTLGIPVYFSTGTQGRGKRVDLSRSYIVLSQTETLSLRKDVQEASRHVLAQLQRIFVFDPIPSHMRDYTPLSDKLLADGSNIAGVLAGLETTRKTEVEKTLTSYLRVLPERDIVKVWTERVGKFQTDAMLYCEEGWSQAATHEIDARGMSDGTLRYLGIVAALLTREPGSLLVIEEVDNGLHPSRAHVLLDMLKTLGKERNIDVIVTTHNPALLDAAGARMVPFITVAHRDEVAGVSELKQLEDLQQLPKLLASGSLGRLSTEGRIESALKLEDQQ